MTYIEERRALIGILEHIRDTGPPPLRSGTTSREKQESCMRILHLILAPGPEACPRLSGRQTPSTYTQHDAHNTKSLHKQPQPRCPSPAPSTSVYMHLTPMHHMPRVCMYAELNSGYGRIGYRAARLGCGDVLPRTCRSLPASRGPPQAATPFKRDMHGVRLGYWASASRHARNQYIFR